MNRNIKYMSISLIVALILILSSTYLIYNVDNESHSFNYKIELRHSGYSFNSSIIVPIPNFTENEEYWINLLLNESNKEGKIDVSLVDTEYGLGMMINSSGFCSLSLEVDRHVPVSSSTMVKEINEDGNGIVHHFYSEYDNSTGWLSVDLDMHNYKITNSEIKIGFSTSAFVYPAPIGWFEWGGVYHEWN